jgi:tetratricopeptide (TPR) repeat protein
MSTTVKVVKSLRSKVHSAVVLQALSHVKDFMTDLQKSLIMLREGRTLFDSGQTVDALECFNEAISFNPSISLFHLRAACHKIMDLHSEAYFDYSFCIRLEPDVGAHYCSRGLCLAKLRKLDLSIEDLNLAIHYDPSGTHYYARGSVFAEFNKFAEAIEGMEFENIVVLLLLLLLLLPRPLLE